MKTLFAFAAAFTVSAATGAFADEAREMRPFEANGLILSGAEYWPYHGNQDINYPADVLWGFYPEQGVVPDGEDEPNPASATTAAVDCATQAYRKLQAFFAGENPAFRRVLELGADHLITNKFYLWTNDYTDAAEPFPPGLRANRFWYWTRNPQIEGRTPGYWKWESVVNQRGECLIPEDAQIAAYIQEKLTELEAP
jgi:hypothetical protein